MAFPSTPSTGKNGKVYISFSDGTKLTSSAMTLQAAYTYKGVAYTNLIYLLGAGKTLINLRPAVEPTLDVDSILAGLDVTPTAANDEVQVSAGSALVDSVVTAVAADITVAVTRPAATQGAWVAISVNKSTGVFTATKGTDTTDAGG